MEKFNCMEYELTHIWHCFGSKQHHRVDLDTIDALLDTSQTNVLPVNTHKLSKSNLANGLVLGYSAITYSDYSKHRNVEKMVKMLNINLQTSATDALEKTQLAYSLVEEPIVKLEVLNRDLATSNDNELFSAVEIIKEWNSDLVILPLVTPNLGTCEKLVSLGCPLLRVMGSPIGSHKGIKDANLFKELCGLGVPVILDGGIGSPDNMVEAFSLGASGILLNSVLFDSPRRPQDVMSTFVSEYQNGA